MLNRFGIIAFTLICLGCGTNATDQKNTQPEVDAGILRDSVDLYLLSAEKLCDSLPLLASMQADRARIISSTLQMPEREAYASKILGNAKFNLESYYEARKHLSFALQYYGSTGKDEIKGKICYLLAASEYHLGNFNNSIEQGIRAREIFKSSNNLPELARVLLHLGLVYHSLGENDQAISCYNESLLISSKLGNYNEIASGYQNLGIVYYKSQNDSLALTYFEKAIEFYKEYHNLKGIGINYSNIGLIYLRSKDAGKAYRSFDKSLTYFTKIDYKLGQMWALNNLGTALAIQGNYQESETNYRNSLKIAVELSNSEGCISNYADLSRLFEHRGIYNQALAYQKKYIGLKDSINRISTSDKLSQLETLYLLESTERQNAQLSSETNRQKARIWAVSGFLSLLILSTLIIISALGQKRKAERNLAEHKTNLENLIEKRTKELQQQISERKVAEESDKLKSAFLANMSHELRTPMNAIIAFSNFLREPELPEDKKLEYLDHITTAGDSLLRIIDDIIDIAKIESRQLKIFIQPTSINRLLQELYRVYSELRVKINKKHIRFNLKMDNEFNYIINTDTQRLKQVLSNLIENAFKYTDKGKIDVGFELTENSVTFFVSDTGIGIPTDKLELIFNRFYQLNHLNDRKTSGTGLGLAISKNLVSLLGGKIWVDSVEGKGSTFSIRIPVESIKKQPNPAFFEETKAKAAAIKKGYNWNNITILVAEDEDLNYKVLDTCLTRTRAHIIRAKDGASAIEICKTQKVDIVLMDIQMPGMDGYEATQEIKRLNNRTPVIAQTSFAMIGEKEKCLQAGCDDFVTKPLNIDTLMQKIEHYIK